MHFWRILFVVLIAGFVIKGCPAQTTKVQTAKNVCHLYGQANSGGNAYNGDQTCVVPETEHLDATFRQGDFICCGGGASSPMSNAHVPPGLELKVSGGYYWSVSSPTFKDGVLGLHLYCGPASSGGPGCNVSVDVIAHYAYDVASPKLPEPTASATETKPIDTKPIDTKPIDTKPQLTTDAEKKIWGIGINSLLAFVFGVVFVLIMLSIAVFDRNPPPNSIFIYRVVLALAAAGVGAVLPGVINLDVSSVVRAGGAAAFFVVVYMVKPAELVAKSKEDDPKNDKKKQGG